MRITNGIMINNNLTNINKNKVNMDNIMTQIETTKKIQRPSEDPITAIRALRLRSTLNEINQYKERNVKDAQSWMETTADAMSSINTALEDIVTYCNQGVSTYQTVDEYEAIIANLKQLKMEVYKTGNTDYGDRTIFTGYKTDNTLSFTEDDKTISYNIYQNFSFEDIDNVGRVVGMPSANINNPTSDYRTAAILNPNCHVLKLGYDNLERGISILDENGNSINIPVDNRSYATLGDRVYANIDSNRAVFVPETGEIIFGDNAYNSLVDKNFTINFDKTGFNNGDLKPENYFTCTKTEVAGSGNAAATKTTEYKEKDQDINYVVSFNQTITVNVQGKDVLTHDIGRDIDEIINRTTDVKNAMIKLEQIESKLKTTTNSTEISNLESYKAAVELEISYAQENLKNSFADGIKKFKAHQQTVSVEYADLGARMKRLSMIEDRLEQQALTVEELKSENEDTNLTQAAVEYNALSDVYDASLSTAAKVVQKSLLDFI